MSDVRAIDVAQLAVLIADNIEDVVDELHLDIVRRTPRLLICSSPFTGKPKLEIQLTGIRGKWSDWSTARYSDALDLVGYALNFEDPKGKEARREAIRWAKRYLGLDGPGVDQAALKTRLEHAQRRAAAQKAKAARELAQARKTAFGHWWSARELQPGDHAWNYFLARGIDLLQLGRRPGSVRFSPAQEWRDDDNEVRHVGPAIMSAMMLPSGEFGSLHRIWIDPDRPGEKADLSHVYDRAPVRKMWPSSEGCAIRLWRGETNLSEKDAAARGYIEDLIICEGVEDGLSIAMLKPERRIVAAGSLPGLLSYVPSKHIRSITVAADNDWDKPQAQAMLERALERFVNDFGKQVRVARSPAGKDFNDLLRERGAE